MDVATEATGVMRTDQFDPQQPVRVYLVFHDGTKGMSSTITRGEAELWLSSKTWIDTPHWEGKMVRSAAIKRVME